MEFEFHVLFKSVGETRSLEIQAWDVRAAVLETASEYPQMSGVAVAADMLRRGIAVEFRLSMDSPEYADEAARDFLDEVVTALNSATVSGPAPEFVVARQTLVAV